MTLVDFLSEHPSPTEADVREALTGSLCRCTGYQNIIRATLDAAAEMRGSAGDE
jgi:carbon-monoxide dehydrogenase small subunit